MSLDDRIHELSCGIMMATGPDELGKTLGLLRAALHSEVTSLNGRVADIVRTTAIPVRDLSNEHHRKPPTGDYSVTWDSNSSKTHTTKEEIDLILKKPLSEQTKEDREKWAKYVEQEKAQEQITNQSQAVADQLTQQVANHETSPQ